TSRLSQLTTLVSRSCHRAASSGTTASDVTGHISTDCPSTVAAPGKQCFKHSPVWPCHSPTTASGTSANNQAHTCALFSSQHLVAKQPNALYEQHGSLGVGSKRCSRRAGRFVKV